MCIGTNDRIHWFSDIDDFTTNIQSSTKVKSMWSCFFFSHIININFKESKLNLQKKYKLITKCKGDYRDPYNHSWSQKDLPKNCFFTISALYEFSRGQYKIYEKGWWETNLVDAKIISHFKFCD